jgi:CheY-like chemotaxis protein
VSFLLVDDDIIFRTIAMKQIELFRITDEVIQAENGREALRKLIEAAKSGNLPKAILLDLNMPIMNGWDFLTQLKDCEIQVVRELPVWVVTSSISTDDADKARTFKQVKGLINKPLSKENLELIKSTLLN